MIITHSNNTFLDEGDSLSRVEEMAGPNVSFIQRFHCRNWTAQNGNGTMRFGIQARESRVGIVVYCNGCPHCLPHGLLGT